MRTEKELLKEIKEIVDDNQYQGGKDSNKTTVIRLSNILGV